MTSASCANREGTPSHVPWGASSIDQNEVPYEAPHLGVAGTIIPTSLLGGGRTRRKGSNPVPRINVRGYRYLAKCHPFTFDINISSYKIDTYIYLKDNSPIIWNLKKSSVFLCIVLLIIVFSAGCIKMGFTYDTKVNKDANLAHAKISLTTDNAGYSMLKSSAKSDGYSSIKEMLMKNLTKSMGKDNILYTENWDKDRTKITISFERTDTFTPSADSQIKIQKVDNTIVYQDDAFYNPSVTKSSSKDESNPYFTKEQAESMANYMLSGITLDYYLEMPGKIVDSNAETIKDNKAEWHATGTDVFNTKIYAKSEVPLLPGFTSIFAIIAFAMLVVYIGITKKN